MIDDIVPSAPVHYVAYFPDGRIQQTGQCDMARLGFQGAPGTIKMETPYPIGASTHFVDVHTGAVIAMPARPSGDLRFDIPSRSWVATKYSDAEMVRIIIDKRNELLSRCDWTQLPDVPLATKTVWAAYRQTLRDITRQASYPQVITWPIPPA